MDFDAMKTCACCKTERYPEEFNTGSAECHQCEFEADAAEQAVIDAASDYDHYGYDDYGFGYEPYEPNPYDGTYSEM